VQVVALERAMHTAGITAAEFGHVQHALEAIVDRLGVDDVFPTIDPAWFAAGEEMAPSMHPQLVCPKFCLSVCLFL
jgi:hypothetical protein